MSRPEGTRSTVCVHLDAVRDEDGAIIGVTNFFYDVTERKQREDQIKRQSELLAEGVTERESLLRELKRANEELSQFHTPWRTTCAGAGSHGSHIDGTSHPTQ